jgi:hypothetical protein
LARTRGRALWAKGKKLWRTEGRLQHLWPEGTQGSHRTQPRVGERGPPACVEVRRGPAIGLALAIRDPAPRPTFRRRTAASALVCCRRQADRGSPQRCSPGIGRGNEHDARPCGCRHRNRADPRLSPKSAVPPRTAVVQTLAIRLLPVLGAWTDQVGSGLLEHVAHAVQLLTSGDQIKHVAVLGRGGGSAFAGSTTAAVWPPSGRVRPGMLATSPTSR